jgi:hypothetical protein
MSEARLGRRIAAVATLAAGSALGGVVLSAPAVGALTTPLGDQSVVFGDGVYDWDPYPGEPGEVDDDGPIDPGGNDVDDDGPIDDGGVVTGNGGIGDGGGVVTGNGGIGGGVFHRDLSPGHP